MSHANCIHSTKETIVKSRLVQSFIRDDGMTTAEYAVGTVATASLAGLLIKILTSPEIQNFIVQVLKHAFSSFFGA